MTLRRRLLLFGTYLLFALFLLYTLFITSDLFAQADEETTLFLPLVLLRADGSSPLPPVNQGTPTATATVDPSASATPSLEPTPSVPPTATLPPTLRPIVFASPQIDDAVPDGEMLQVTWSGCPQATGYKLLYGPLGQRPSSVQTEQTSIELGPLTTSGSYQLLLVCIVDALGDSVFAAPELCGGGTMNRITGYTTLLPRYFDRGVWAFLRRAFTAPQSQASHPLSGQCRLRPAGGLYHQAGDRCRPFRHH